MGMIEEEGDRGNPNRDPYPLLTPDERDALDHVIEIERGPYYPGRKHKVTACPPMTRAMCMYRRPLESAYKKYPELRDAT